MIRNSQDVAGIKIEDKMFKLNQYADDTQLFLGGSEKSLKEKLKILNTFYRMLSLKIYVEKTRAMWIVSRSNSNDRLCTNFDLDWTQGPFKVLKVNFASDINNIWELNQQ